MSAPPRPVILLLGHRLQDDAIHPELAARVESAARAWRALRDDGRDAWIVATGGRANPRVARTEADVMGEALRDAGLPADRILLERDALDTLGNAVFSRALLASRGIAPEELHVVTSRYHLARAVFTFGRAFVGVPVRGVAALWEDRAAEAAEPARLAAAQVFFAPLGERPTLEDLLRALRDRHDLYRR